MKVAELEGRLLDYWVARAEGYSESDDSLMMHVDGTCRIAWHEGDDPDSLYNPSAAWMWGGPIIEREQIYLIRSGDATVWLAAANVIWLADHDDFEPGETALIAAMRAYVASKFGNEVPDENI